MGISGRIARFFQASQLTPLLALVAFLMGLFAVAVTPREEEPQINVTMANVLVPFPGASARDVETLVATPAEQVLAQMTGIEHVYSVSRPGMAVLTVQFKVWRIDEGYCGYAVAEMPLLLDTDMAFTKVTITPGDATVVEGEGIGAAAAEEDKLVDDNQELVEEFRTSLSEQVGSTFNYEELDLEGSHILFNTVGVAANPAALETFLEITVLADE